jgi:integrase/recombinase XerD
MLRYRNTSPPHHKHARRMQARSGMPAYCITPARRSNVSIRRHNRGAAGRLILCARTTPINRSLKALFAWLCEEKPELAPHNPTLSVRKIKYATDGHHSWTSEEIKRYRDRHAIGSKARLALDLLLYTGGRREDAPRLGPQHVRNGRVQFRQAKNDHRNPIDIDIPAHPQLLASIAAAPSGHMTFLVTEYGKSFTTNGFGEKFKHWCRQANLPHCSAHGLRKACATVLAEAGASEHEIASVTGHQSLEEIERYTRAAERKRLADRAMKKFKP